MDLMIAVARETWLLTAEMAPYLVMGFAVAGLLHVFVPMDLVARHLGGEGPLASLKASILGIPLPLCSCGVLPVAASLRKAGAGKAPTLSFLITTPVTGVDSLLATWALMGGPFTLVRLVASFFLGLGTGLVRFLVGDPGEGATATGHDGAGNAGDDAGPRRDAAATSIRDTATPEGDGSSPRGPGLGVRLLTAMRYAFFELPGMIAGSILAGLLIGGVIAAVVPPSFIHAHIGTGLLGLVVAVLFAIPLYVCATGSIPIAAAMLAAGFSPGAALAFLVAGPATNAVAITTVKKILGGRSVVVYLSMIFVGALGFGLLFDVLAPAGSAMHDMVSEHMGGHGPGIVSLVSGGILAVLLVVLYAMDNPLVRLIARRRASTPSADVTLRVEGMSCKHCAAKVTTTLEGLDAVEGVTVDLASKHVYLRATPSLNVNQALSALADAGYEPSVLRDAADE